ncbi:TetR/AcrR family transcriptional regulator [Veronia pacifica]|uniref:HTH tetR-type domain-containing protein n=1 Tax=Veronia pacifica TaxID=1080227 RepID=A0A1C3EST2_9GAMM|nr:TetR/AcrR family transcriptional regulator [Veronia pacifica]ODA36312.1 hypothetical protein A8L45_01030 [Veronia pacifica]
MARTKKFVREEKLIEAMNLFRRKGFSQTSIADLVEELKINRFSLYDSFTDKETLYRESLSHYLIADMLPSLEPLKSSNAGINEIIKYINSYLSLLEEEPFGCLLQNALIERGYCDDEVIEICNSFFVAMEEAVSNALKNDIERGIIRGDTDVSGASGMMITQLQGMRVLSKGRQMPIVSQSKLMIENIINGFRHSQPAVEI